MSNNLSDGHDSHPIYFLSDRQLEQQLQFEPQLQSALEEQAAQHLQLPEEQEQSFPQPMMSENISSWRSSRSVAYDM